MPLCEILTISRDCAPTFWRNNSKEMNFSYCQTWFQVIILKSVYYLVWTLSLSEGGWWVFCCCFPKWKQFNFQDYPNSVFWERKIITNKSASYCFLNVIFIFQTIFFYFNRLMLFRKNIVFLDFHCVYVCIPLKHKTKMKLGQWPHTCNFSSHEAEAGRSQSGLG